MKLEDQVCSLELATRLDQLGIRHKSHFEWLFYPQTMEWKITPAFNTQLGLPAYTVAELGEILPKSLPSTDKCWKSVNLKCEPANKIGNWLISYGHDIWAEDSTEANARAKILISLLENKLNNLHQKDHVPLDEYAVINKGSSTEPFVLERPDPKENL